MRKVPGGLPEHFLPDVLQGTTMIKNKTPCRISGAKANCYFQFSPINRFNSTLVNSFCAVQMSLVLSVRTQIQVRVSINDQDPIPVQSS